MKVGALKSDDRFSGGVTLTLVGSSGSSQGELRVEL